MGRQRFDVEVPDGMRLGFARTPDGGMRGLLFDKETNKLAGHAELFEPEDHDVDRWSDIDQDSPDAPPERSEASDEFIDAISTALVDIAEVGIRRAAPHIRRWWRDKVAPSARSTSEKVTSKLRRATGSKNGDDTGVAADLVTKECAEASNPSGMGGNQLESLGPTMTSEEARHRLVMAADAEAFAQAQMRLLHHARIIGEDPMGLTSALNELSPQSIEAAIHQVLEEDPSMLDRQNFAGFRRSLGPGQQSDELVPLTSDTTRLVLRLAKNDNRPQG